MRVLVITNMYPPHHLGGYELSCRDVVDRWRSKGHEVVVLTSDLKLTESAEADDQSEGVYRRLAIYWRDHEMVPSTFWESLRTERRNQETLGSLISEFRPDVVSAWHMGAMSLGLLTSVQERAIPLVLVVCDDWMVYAPRADAWSQAFRNHRLASRVVRLVSRVPTRLPRLDDATVTFVSEFIRGRALSHSMWQPKISTVAYSGVDVDEFPFRAPSSEWDGNLLCVGRVEERKGVHVAIEALASLPHSTLTVCGQTDRTYLRRLESLIRDLGVGDRVSFTHAPRRSLSALYHGADALVFPVIWDEPFGLVPLEAMACGTPVIATAKGGSREFLVDGLNCVETPPGNPDGLVEGVARLASDERLRKRIVEGGRKTVTELGVDSYASYLEEWHLASAASFARGRPHDRRRIADIIRSSVPPSKDFLTGA